MKPWTTPKGGHADQVRAFLRDEVFQHLVLTQPDLVNGYMDNLAGLTGADLADLLSKPPSEDWQGGKKELVDDYELKKPHATTLLRAFARRITG